MIGLDTILQIGEKVLDRVMPDPQAKAAAQMKLMDLQQSGELERMRSEFKDIESARDRETKIATSDAAPLLNKIVTPVLALGTVAMSFVLFGILIFVEVKSEAKDIIIYVLGALTSAITMVLGYYFGSSQGSKEKTDELRQVFHGK